MLVYNVCTMHRRITTLPKKLESATRGLLYTLIFFLPLWFVPLTSDLLEMNKQVFFLVLTCAAALTWTGSMLFAKQFHFQRGWINLLPLSIVIAIGVSAFQSSAPYLSWVGSQSQEYTSFLTFAGCAIFFYLIVNVFRDRFTHRTLHTLLLISALVTGLIGVYSLFGISLSSLGIVEQKNFNTVGTINALGVYLGVLSVFGAALYVTHRKDDALLHQKANGAWERLVIFLLWLSTLIYLLATDYWVLWAIFLFGMSSLFVFGLFRAKDFEKHGRMWMPMVSISVALAFLIWLPTPFTLIVPSEITPSFDASNAIAKQIMSFDGSYGTGPGTYAFDYAQYRGKEINSTDFWNTRFDRAASFVYTLLPTIGSIGVGSLAFFIIVLFVRCLVQMLKPRSREDWLQSFVFFSPWVTLVFATFLYSFNMTLVFLFFVLTGMLGSQIIRRPYTKSYTQSPGLALLFSTVLVAGSIVLFIGIFISAERYVAEIAFAKALKIDGKNGSVQDVVSLVDTAATLNRFDDRYFRTLSEAILLRVAEQLKSAPNTSELTAESRQYVQSLVAASVNAAVRSTDLSPRNALNWNTRGRVYRELISLVPDAAKFAIEAHQKAVNLEPNNPRAWNELGKTFLAAAERERAMTAAEQKDIANQAQKNLDAHLQEAESKFLKAIELKSNYAAAHYQLGLTYERQGRLDDAIAKLESIASYNPSDIGVAFQLGQLYLRRNVPSDLPLAQKQFERAVELSPSFSNARWFLASVYERLDEKPKAIEQIEAVATLNPGNEIVKNRLERLLRGDQNEPTVEVLP